MTTYTHDCDECLLLETGSKLEGETVDWYYCTKSLMTGGTMIARYGNDGCDYVSQPIRLLYNYSPFSMKALEILSANLRKIADHQLIPS